MLLYVKNLKYLNSCDKIYYVKLLLFKIEGNNEKKDHYLPVYVTAEVSGRRKENEE